MEVFTILNTGMITIADLDTEQNTKVCLIELFDVPICMVKFCVVHPFLQQNSNSQVLPGGKKKHSLKSLFTLRKSR